MGIRCRRLSPLRIGTFIVTSTWLCFLYFMIKDSPNTDKSSSDITTKYNLLDEGKHQPLHVKDCTLEYANSQRLQQDHPCVLELVKRSFLKEPFPRHVPYELRQKDKRDPSAGQANAIMRILHGQENGFYVEYGASDGEFLSNTLFMERYKNWTGLLIEPDPDSYEGLLSRKRKGWHVPACLSLEMYPTQVTFNPAYQTGKIQDYSSSWLGSDYGKTLVTVQCFPFYSILLAHGRTSVDYFSLDIKGHELKVLKTIPWHKVDIKTLSVEWKHVDEGEDAIVSFMEQNGFVNFGKIAANNARNIVFVKDFLRDLRYDYDD